VAGEAAYVGFRSAEGVRGEFAWALSHDQSCGFVPISTTMILDRARGSVSTVPKLFMPSLFRTETNSSAAVLTLAESRAVMYMHRGS